ncbi:hypothetical protein OK349_11350 [Sphingomonas sp. BT-65]|uniref:hypothetical protein n=1 Tax=Sphingomonas sp. BT-65 TaxID=2989821 RepID=UPI00223632A2|nr:hypothetical protein [Sphingomonas sp. BT-65]MCW4462302.1 hypothetical protein [Sphingomonas sp. BT-65]
MKKAFAFLASSVALLGSQTVAAQEAYIVPDATSPWVFTGTVDVNKGIALTCTAEVEITGTNDAADTSPPFNHSDVAGLSATITLTGGLFGLCSSVNIAPIPAGKISYSGSTFTLHDVFVTTITPGNCEGDIVATWNEGLQRLSVAGTLPAVSGADCTLDGDVDLDTPSSGNAVEPGDGDYNPNHP